MTLSGMMKMSTFFLRMAQALYAAHVQNSKATNNQGVVRMRHNFESGNWFQHKKCVQHCNAVLNLVAESNDKNLKIKHQGGLVSFLFTTVTNKKKISSTRSSSSSSSATP